MKVIVLCGGKGMRLKPIIDSIPKPMVDLNGKPILEHIVEYFKLNGFTDFTFAIGYKGNIIKNHFGKKYKDCNIKYSDAGDVSILQRIKFASKRLKEDFMVVYGDTIANVSLSNLLAKHLKTNALVTITTYQMQSPFGIVEADLSSLITNFKEKPFLNHWINIGFMVFNPISLKTQENDLIEFFRELIGLDGLFEYKHEGKHITINTIKEKKKAEEDIKYFYTLDGGIKNGKK